MFTEKTKLVEKRENPFYGSYKEKNIAEEIHWQNKRKRQQLAMVSAVILILVILSIGITLAITLPPMLEISMLDPADPDDFLSPSPSVLRQLQSAGVSSESALCSEMGKTVLEAKSGSAVDAAVAVTLCHGVTNPQSSGLGGGLFMVIYTGNETWAVNAREIAPALADPVVYERDPNAASRGGLSVGVPGELAGLWDVHQKFGKVPWSELVQPVRLLAEEGFAVSPQLARSLQEHANKIKGDSVLRSEFVNPSTGEVWLAGDLLKRSRLATTLLDLEQNGVTGFYNGTIAAEIVREIGASKGIINLEDLASYSVEWESAFEYGLTSNLTLHSLSFPSSGPVIALALGILHGFGKRHSADLVDPVERGLDEHQLAEVLKFANAHRSLIADPDYTDMSEIMDQLLSVDYANELRAMIDPYKTFDDPKHYGAVYSLIPDKGTSQISILGTQGDAVSVTTSINLGFGAGFMGDKTGIIYNNVMRDFSIGNTTDVYGLAPNQLNEVEPGKRPASSMAPLIVVNDQGLPVLATGASGGVQILSALISTSWRSLYRYLDIKSAIDYPRFMPSFHPTQVFYEYGLPLPVVAEMKRRGHKMTRLDTVADIAVETIGNVNSVCRVKHNEMLLANADARKNGESAGF